MLFCLRLEIDSFEDLSPGESDRFEEFFFSLGWCSFLLEMWFSDGELEEAWSVRWLQDKLPFGKDCEI